MIENEFVAFYDKHKISPVSQDISDLQAHIKRRMRLYRSLGINGKLFSNAEILEAGAGSGYNSLVFLLLGAKMDIVEPNPTGRDVMLELFNTHKIPPNQYKIHPTTIEKYKTNKQYDFVIAEGFLPSFKDKEIDKILASLCVLVKSGGVLVVTAADEISYFFEYLRILVGLKLVRDTCDFDRKVEILIHAFARHLDTLKFASRPISDWVKDSILNPTCDYFSLSIADVVERVCALDSAFQVTNTSPNLVCNLSWYKDASYSYARAICDGFYRKWHLLLCTEFSDSVRDVSKNLELKASLKSLRKMVKEYRDGADNLSIKGGGYLPLKRDFRAPCRFRSVFCKQCFRSNRAA